MATHLWVTASRGGHKTLFGNIFGRVSEKYRNVLQNVFSKVDKKVEPKTKRANKTEAGCQIKSVPIPVCTTTLSRQVFAKLFPQKSIQTFASEWRLATARKLISSSFARTRHIPVFAFVGLGFAAQEESFWSTNQEFICTEIRKLFQVFDSKRQQVAESRTDLRIQDFQFGEFIAKGSSSAVYEAKIAENVSTDKTSVDDVLSSEADVSLVDELEWNKNQVQPARNPEALLALEFADNFTEAENTPFLSSEVDVGHVGEMEWDVSPVSSTSNITWNSDSDDDIGIIDDAEFDAEVPSVSSRNFNELGIMLASSMVDSVLRTEDVAQMNDLHEASFAQDEDSMLHSNSHSEFDLAIKMMFNYYAESTTEAVTMAMEKEMVPIKLASPTTTYKWKFWKHRKKKKCLPPHPNIVEMRGVFVDQVADLPGNLTQYPYALPQRLNPYGCGRNSTMFLVMKRYSTTLREYLESKSVNVYESCILICQLLEGVTFLGDSEIAHRDLKSDNILMDLKNQALPWLVISDFGCCLSDGLKIPFNTKEIPKGGNSALMAPEIACAKPGWFSVLDYRRSDLWTVGSLIYEVFGKQNPFYSLDSRTYKECDLPLLPGNCPWLVKKLVSCLLQRDPHKRLEPAVAANVMQLFLWWPSHWFKKKPSNEKVQKWLMTFYRDALLFVTELDVSVEHKLQREFLSRLHFHELIAAVNFIFD